MVSAPLGRNKQGSRRVWFRINAAKGESPVLQERIRGMEGGGQRGAPCGGEGKDEQAPAPQERGERAEG